MGVERDLSPRLVDRYEQTRWTLLRKIQANREETDLYKRVQRGLQLVGRCQFLVPVSPNNLEADLYQELNVSLE